MHTQAIEHYKGGF